MILCGWLGLKHQLTNKLTNQREHPHGSVSNGCCLFVCAVLVDLTAPETGEVIDGLRANFEDIRFSVHPATVAAQWRNFQDPESGITQYEVQVERAE